MNRWLLVGSCWMVLFATTACEPIVMIPGGELSGVVTPVPADWSFTSDVETLQLETNPSDAYSVNIWGIGIDSRFYVAGSKTSQWTENAAKDPRVRLRIDDKLYVMNAVMTEDESDFVAFTAALKEKYDHDIEPGQRDTSVLFLLEAR